MLPPTSPPIPPSFAPSSDGTWIPVYDWTSFLPSNPNPGFFHEIGHGALIPTGSHRGHVLFWNFDFTIQNGQNLATAFTNWWDPSNPTQLNQVTQPLLSDIFCSGMSWKADGTLLVAGGLQLTASGSAPNASYVFDPLRIDAGTPWQTAQFMADYRYYPTLVTLDASQSHRTLVIGGTAAISANAFGTKGLQTQPTGSGSWEPRIMEAADPTATPFEAYPRAFQLSDGRLLAIGDVQVSLDAFQLGNAENTFPGSCQLVSLPSPGSADPATIQTAAPLYATLASPSPIPPPNGSSELAYFDVNYGSAVLLHQRAQNGGLDRILVFGGSEGIASNSPNSLGVTYPVTVRDLVREYTPSMNGPGSWSVKASMNVPRTHLNAVVLPTGKVFVVGGTWSDHLTETSVRWQPVPVPEPYDPGPSNDAIGSTRYLARPQPGVGAHPSSFPWTPRVYHSVAILLPDARVLVAGGENVVAGTSPWLVDHSPAAWTGEVFSPPYLFQGFCPLIDIAPDRASFGIDFTMKVSSNVPGTVDRIVLLRPAAITHHFDSDQRYIELDFQLDKPGAFPGQLTYRVTSPSSNLAPKGYFMMFVILSNGVARVPSAAHWIFLQ